MGAILHNQLRIKLIKEVLGLVLQLLRHTTEGVGVVPAAAAAQRLIVQPHFDIKATVERG